jgi:formate-dependent phosphoribosylglycinamide formyltransferase (GAR transformylase)
MKTFVNQTGLQIGRFKNYEQIESAWLCDGVIYPLSVLGDVVISDYVEPPADTPEINVISMRQARLQLLAMDLLDAVNTQISTMSQAAQIEWEYATEVQRSNPLVSALQTALSMTDSDMDLFFSDASVL